MMWGSNIPVTRTPDSHFMVETRYQGTKIVVVSPDFADSTKFADEWLRINPETDSALAFAMGHVILSEFHVRERTPYFMDYMRRFTDAPFLVELDAHEAGGFVPGKFLTASEVSDPELHDSPNAEHRLLVMEADGAVKDPGGTIADRYGDDGVGKWNLRLDGVDPVMSIADVHNSQAAGEKAHGAHALTSAAPETAELLLPRFDLPANPDDDPAGPVGAGIVRRGVPVARVGNKLVTTVFDLMLAHYGVNRPELNLPGTWPSGYDDAEVGTPAWAEELTGVPAAGCERVAREFAQNAVDSKGRSQIIMGAGVNHYFNADSHYRTFLALTSMCGTQGVNGGGWAHYVRQEKLRPMNGWAQYAFGLDWSRPPRQMITTGFYYLTTSQWRYDSTRAARLASPLATHGTVGEKLTSDTLIEAMKRGWMPAYPQFNRNSLTLADAADAAGMDVKDYIVEQLRTGEMEFACEDPDNPVNFPRILLNWRTNLMGSSAKGTEFFLRHMLGVDSDATAEELAKGNRPASIRWRENAPTGKLDLMMTTDFRTTSTTLVSDIVLPAATWYEKNDLSTTDMHPFIHSFNAAINPPWEARSDFEVFRDLAQAFSELTVEWLGTQRDVVTAPLGHDSPDELANARGVVPDLTETGLIPGKTMAKLIPVERDCTKIFEKWLHFGPLTAKLGTGTHGTAYNVAKQVDELALINSTGETSIGERPMLDTAPKVIETILHLSGVSNGEVALEGFKNQSKRVGTDMTVEVADSVGARINWDMIKERPAEVISSPEWTGSKKNGRRYTAFSLNLEYQKPWHTISGRMHYYLDHDWFQDYGEALPIYRPPFDHVHINGEVGPGETGRAAHGEPEVTVRYLTPHNKWSIHSQYHDNLHVLSISRGGQVIWMPNKDAEAVGIKDNDWIEAYNRNGIVTARAIVSHRIPAGTVFMNHAQERTTGTPVNEYTGRRGGTHNSLTRIMIKPIHVAGGYGHLTYGFNYIGPTGNNRDEVTRIRRRSQEVEY